MQLCNDKRLMPLHFLILQWNMLRKRKATLLEKYKDDMG